MKRTLVALALSTTVLTTPALARDDSSYVQLDFGAMSADKFKVDRMSPPPGPAGVLDTKVGFDTGLVFGYDFGAFRLESEISFRKADNKSLSTPLPG